FFLKPRSRNQRINIGHTRSVSGRAYCLPSLRPRNAGPPQVSLPPWGKPGAWRLAWGSPIKMPGHPTVLAPPGADDLRHAWPCSGSDAFEGRLGLFDGLAADGDTARLGFFRHPAHEVDMEQTVLQISA